MSAKRQDKKYKEMYDLYISKGINYEQLGKLFNMSGACVRTGFLSRGFEVRSRLDKPCQYFMDYKFTLRGHGYFAKSTGDRELIHREVWKFFNGDIPKNCSIHHKDNNRWNNQIENLELISEVEHGVLHYKERIIDCKGRFI